MKVGVIGLGSMGMGAALNLLKSQHQVVGCELRDTARAELAGAGGSAVASAAELPDDLDALIVFVVNAAQADDVLFGPAGCASRLPAGAVVLLCTTVAPEAARKLDEKVTAAGLLMLGA